jgi:GNAT superfamily N-acetyltransferase
MIEMFHLRQACAADAKAIAQVEVDCKRERGILPRAYLDQLSYERGTEKWQSHLAENLPLKAVFVIEGIDAVSPVGFAVAGPSRNPEFPYQGELWSIFLLRKIQGRGMGKMLLEACRDHIKSCGFQDMFVWVLKDNPAVGFYKRFGAVEFSSERVNIGGADLEEIALGWKTLNWQG